MACKTENRCSGQKCSAQSILFVHENWSKSGILDKLKTLASQRTLKDLTVSAASSQLAYRLSITPSPSKGLRGVPCHVRRIDAIQRCV